MNKTKQAEFEFKLRIYLKYLKFKEHFDGYIDNLRKKLSDDESNFHNLQLLCYIKNMAWLYFTRTYVNDTYYTEEQNTNDFINAIPIKNMDDFILDELLQHLNFINEKYILENSQ